MRYFKSHLPTKQISWVDAASLDASRLRLRCPMKLATMAHETATVRIKIVLTRWSLRQDNFLFSLDKLSCFPWAHERHFFSLLFNEFDVSVEVKLGWCCSTNWQYFSNGYLYITAMAAYSKIERVAAIDSLNVHYYCTALNDNVAPSLSKMLTMVVLARYSVSSVVGHPEKE